MQLPFLLHLLLSVVSAIAVATTADNPFTPKASFLRYWTQKIPNRLPKPAFLLSKLSPLTPHNSAILQSFADQNALSTQLPSFCAWANLFCFPQTSPSLAKHNGYSNFANYVNQNFTNYGTRALGDGNSFKNYSDGENVVADSFKRYSRESLGHKDTFVNYGPDVNVLSEQFSSYSVSGLGNSGEFTNYGRNGNVPNLGFNAYDQDGTGTRSFSSYSDETNAGDQSFSSYGRKSTGIPTSFTSYAKDSNVLGSTFSGYGESAVAANDTFTSYGKNGNVPTNTFKSYGDRGNFGSESFNSYRDQSNVGDDSFLSYAKSSNYAKATFTNYGNSANPGSDAFKHYGKGANNQTIGFKTYSNANTTFKDYEKKNTISFAEYKTITSSKTRRGITTNKWVVEEGKFFRESNLKQGTVMKMPDITDKMPPRSFLPRSLAKKLPFSSAQMGELLKDFNSDENSTLANIVGKTLKECEREPSRGETKRCVTSAEDMVDFAVQVLGKDVTVKSTECLGGSKGKVEIGRVVGINGGKVTKSVSCHQSLFPYLVYFCHSVPKVRVYEADILDVEKKQKINHGLAICHIDTSSWGRGHGAFTALGGRPGQIEVCHWIFQNDMTWVAADH
ncbi:polygalacturonase 1 beta-like protein 3 [Aristolochia californica]|uniref:polygalacturonase 1 beta-like protein 3 n=1 Tax=Aristolochia californica TaxID=171875 RepID=UPI0035D7BBAA